jgi:hypothetical protein
MVGIEESKINKVSGMGWGGDGGWGLFSFKILMSKQCNKVR